MLLGFAHSEQGKCKIVFEDRSLVLEKMTSLVHRKGSDMGDVANQDEAKKCLEIAGNNLSAGHLEKAQRFAEKAMKLYPNDEVSFKRRLFLSATLMDFLRP